MTMSKTRSKISELYAELLKPAVRSKEPTFKDWVNKGIVPNRFIWWCYKLQFWRYREIMPGVLMERSRTK
jgi:hypothetical protein